MLTDRCVLVKVAGMQPANTSLRGSVGFALARVHNSGPARKVTYITSMSGTGKLYVRHDR